MRPSLTRIFGHSRTQAERSLTLGGSRVFGRIEIMQTKRPNIAYALLPKRTHARKARVVLVKATGIKGPPVLG
jgi:hypothetical protein